MKNWTLAVALGTAVVTTGIGLGVNPASAGTLWDVSFTIQDSPNLEYFKGQFVLEDVLSTDPTTGFSGYRIIDLVNGTQGENPTGGNPAVSLLPVGQLFPPPRGAFTNDNLFNPQNPSFSVGGISYQEVGGDEKYNLFYDNGYKGMPYVGPPFVDNPPDFPIPARILTVTDFRATLIPEPSSILGFLALGTLGAASALKRKLKPTKSAEKETEKVG